MLVVPEFLKPLLAGPVAVLGGGISGRSAAQLVARLGGQPQIFDEKGGEGILSHHGVSLTCRGVALTCPGSRHWTFASVFVKLRPHERAHLSLP